jgi:hypothetical protein
LFRHFNPLNSANGVFNQRATRVAVALLFRQRVNAGDALFQTEPSVNLNGGFQLLAAREPGPATRQKNSQADGHRWPGPERDRHGQIFLHRNHQGRRQQRSKPAPDQRGPKPLPGQPPMCTPHLPFQRFHCMLRLR